jgi:triphosphatase
MPETEDATLTAPVDAPETTEATETGEPTPGPEGDSEPTGHDGDASGEASGEVAFAILRAHFDLLRAHEPAVEHSDDPAVLHELRVDIRRLRAALGLFADALPARAAALHERLGELGVILGALRDLDVQSARVAGWVATAEGEERNTLEFVATALDGRRRQARRRVVSTLTSKRTGRQIESLERLLAGGPPKRSSTARTPILVLAPELLTHEHRKVVVLGDSIGPESPADALHSVRIRAKRLRYAVESLKPWYGKAARAYAKRLHGVEDVLGAHQDAFVAAGTLRDIGLGSARRLGPAQLLTLGALAERCLEQARVAHRSFPTAFAPVSGRRWRRLVRTMDDARA